MYFPLKNFGKKIIKDVNLVFKMLNAPVVSDLKRLGEADGDGKKQ